MQSKVRSIKLYLKNHTRHLHFRLYQNKNWINSPRRDELLTSCLVPMCLPKCFWSTSGTALLMSQATFCSSQIGAVTMGGNKKAGLKFNQKKKKKRKIKTGVALSVGILNPYKNCGIVTWTDHNLTAFHSFPYFPQVKGLTKFLSLVSPLHLFKLTHWFLRHLLWPLQVSSVSSTLSEQKLAKHQVPMQYLTYSFAVSIL